MQKGKIRYEDLPAVLTPEIIDRLVDMMLESPQSNEWHDLSVQLTSEQFWRIVRAKEERHELHRARQSESIGPETQDSYYRAAAIHLARDHYFFSIFDEYELVQNLDLSLEKIKQNPHLADLHDKVKFRRSYMTDTEKFTYFSSSDSIFAQCYPASILIGDVTFSSSLHYVEYAKAVQFRDEDRTKRIMLAKSQQEIYELGRSVRFFTDIVWEMVLTDILHRSIKEKFLQHAGLRQALLSTKATTIVLAAPDDMKWGIGLAREKVEATKRRLWRGKNLLGELLTYIRYELTDNY